MEEILKKLQELEKKEQQQLNKLKEIRKEIRNLQKAIETFNQYDLFTNIENKGI